MISETRRRPRVLVVDDHAINLRLTRRLLELEGYEPYTAPSGAAALAVAAELAPDLVLADLFLADMTGEELLGQLRDDPDTACVRVAAFTAAAMAGDREAALHAGFDGYLAKPVSAVEFGRFVAGQLSSAPGDAALKAAG